MLLKQLSLAALAGYALAQNQDLVSTLSGNSNLSALVGLLNSTGLVGALGGSSNITVLAPSNQAIETLLNSSAGAQLASNPGLVTAALQYHVLNGTYRAEQITNTSVFVPTLLTNETYTNVTGGQRVQAMRSADGNVTFFSGLVMNSTVTQPVSRLFWGLPIDLILIHS